MYAPAAVNQFTRFFPGQKVRIRPNGLPMTVVEVLPDTSVVVKWLDHGIERRGRFESWRLGRCK